MKITIANELSEFYVDTFQGVFRVTPRDKEDDVFAQLAVAAIKRSIARYYCPALGPALVFAADVAAKVLNCKIVTEIPPGDGELEQGRKPAR